MNTSTSLLVMVVLLVAMGTACAALFASIPAGPGPVTNEITLTAPMVKSAVDIENVIHTVTANGTRPGMIIFDGRNGPFFYTGDDRSINIFYPNLTFRGINNAYFPNSDDGFFFDDLSVDNIKIENLFMISKGSGIAGAGRHSNVEVHGNFFMASGTAVAIRGGNDWTITGNTILAGAAGLQIINGGSSLTVSDNQVKARIGITVEGIEKSSIYNNTLNVSSQGILITGEANGNEIFNNRILGAQGSGIALQPGVVKNRVYDNKVQCATGSECKTVDALPAVAEMNWISGNLF